MSEKKKKERQMIYRKTKGRARVDDFQIQKDHSKHQKNNLKWKYENREDTAFYFIYFRLIDTFMSRPK